MSLKETLKKLMLREGNISVSYLAKATNLPQSTLHQLCFGATQRPRKRTLDVLAHYFSVSVPQLLGQEFLAGKLSSQLKKQLNLHPTPLLTWDELALWPNEIDFSNKEETILEHNDSPLTFALEMTGSTMEPLFPQGCLLIFDGNKTAKDKDCVLVYRDDVQEFSFKRIFYDGNTVYIKAINPELNGLGTFQLKEKDRILASLVEARIKF